MALARVTFTIGAVEYSLGYHEWLTFDYDGNTMTKIIPRATGVKILSTEEVGGGILVINVSVIKKADSRLELEQDVNTLISNIKGQSGTLSVESTLNLTNCYMDSLSMSGEDQKVCTLELKFIKSV